MIPSAYRVRRATVDDLAGLIPLWESMHFPAGELERRLTEFQLIESQDGRLLGVIGMAVIDRHGCLHSEAFVDFALTDDLRPLLWDRMKSIAASTGLARIWSTEPAPFWKQEGFYPAGNPELIKLPAEWTSFEGDWLTLELRDEELLKGALETAYVRLKQEQGQDSQELLRRAQMLKYIAIALGVLVAIAGIAFCVYLLRQYPRLLHN